MNILYTPGIIKYFKIRSEKNKEKKNSILT